MRCRLPSTRSNGWFRAQLKERKSMKGLGGRECDSPVSNAFLEDFHCEVYDVRGTHYYVPIIWWKLDKTKENHLTQESKLNDVKKRVFRPIADANTHKIVPVNQASSRRWSVGQREKVFGLVSQWTPGSVDEDTGNGKCKSCWIKVLWTPALSSLRKKNHQQGDRVP